MSGFMAALPFRRLLVTDDPSDPTAKRPRGQAHDRTGLSGLEPGRRRSSPLPLWGRVADPSGTRIGRVRGASHTPHPARCSLMLATRHPLPQGERGRRICGCASNVSCYSSDPVGALVTALALCETLFVASQEFAGTRRA